MPLKRRNLFRAVRPAELVSIRQLERFTNLPGLECKYFATNLEGAVLYAGMAQDRYADGPYTLVQTSIEPGLLPPDCDVVVERGIATVIIPTELLYALAPPRILDEQ
jgi:hypothetical protein